MAITKISFLARYHTREIHYDTVRGRPFGPVSYAKTQTVQHDKEAVFVLGPGPCGKTVDKLDVRFQEHDIVIVQYHDGAVIVATGEYDDEDIYSKDAVFEIIHDVDILWG